MKHKVEQLKWLYGAFTGACVTYFLALLSSNQPVSDSLLLFLATCLFAGLLPVFAGFTFAHAYLIEDQTPAKKIEAALGSERVRNLTKYALWAFFAAFVLLVSHFSLIAGAIMLGGSWYIRDELKAFIGSVRDGT
ncbi:MULTISPECIES: hypothetical protein [Marinobacter]|jgi:hypothetical protein|uniref:hypothetical protein n=1 Tax=Marinobacter TaxID=2742 RepID=UPI003267E36E